MRITMSSLQVLIVALFLSLMASCATDNGIEKTFKHEFKSKPMKPAPYIIQSGDELDIKFFFNQELNETLRVRPDGKISLQLVDEIQAAGLRPSELDRLLTQEYAHELKNPKLTVIVRSFSAHRVYVGGEVYRKGTISLSNGMTPLQAVISAGGFLESAAGDKALIIRKGPDNRPVPINVNLFQHKRKDGDIILQPNDIIYIPKSGIANVNKFIDQYIRGLLLFQGWDFGIGYDINNNSNK